MRPLVGLCACLVALACAQHSDGAGEAGRGTPAEGARSDPSSARSGPTRAVQVAAGNYSACVRFDDGSVSCWGRCDQGCARRSHETSSGLRPIAGITDAVDVAVGDGFACVADAGGRARCWGSNFYGALGVAGVDWAGAPREVEDLAEVVEVEAAQTMVCARTRGGEVFAWGGVADASPPPPASTRTPRRVPGMKGATALFADSHGCCAALGGGFACIRPEQEDATPRPSRTGDCGCALDRGGRLRCEIRSLPGPPTIDGEHPEPPLLPCSIESLDDVRVFAIADTAGYAIRGDGELWRWGGLDRWGTAAPLERMAALSGVRSIATGIRGGVFAVDEAGTLWGWAWSHEHGITEGDGWIDAPVRIWIPPGA